MLTLNDGRKNLYQWDVGRIATVNVECDTVHFSNLKYGNSLPVEVKDGEVAIPNQLLLSGSPLYCWAFATDNDGEYTKKEQTIEVVKRAKPSDYLYTETEIITIQAAVENAIEQAKESGDFKGEDGKSAYEIAKDNGFNGTEKEWLDSLKGEKGESSVDVVQDTGDSDTAVMSQRAVTEELTKLAAVRLSNNMIDVSTASERGEWWYNGKKYGYASGNDTTKCSVSYKVAVKPNTKYYGILYSLSTKYFTSSILYASCFNANDVFLAGFSTTTNFTTPENADYVMLTFMMYKSVDSDEIAYMPFFSDKDYSVVGYDEYKVATLESLQKEIDTMRSNSLTATLKTPAQYELVVGDTFELFYKGIIDAVDTDLFYVEIECIRGSAYKKRFIFTPTGAETVSMTISLYDLHHNLLDTKTINLIVKAKAPKPSTEKTVLYVSDSLGGGGYVPNEFYRRLTGSGGSPVADGLSNISFIGTCISELDGVKYEGYGGWTFTNYNAESKSDAFMWITTAHDKTADDQHSTYKDGNGATWKLETIEASRIKLIRTKGNSALPATGTLTWESGGVSKKAIVYTASVQASGNPFWNESTSKVDFANYVKTQGKSTLDYVYVLLGWNSLGERINNYSSYRVAAQTFINNVLSAYPNCKIVLLGLQIPAQDGCGANYGATTGYSKYRPLLTHVWALNDLYADLAENNANVSFVNISGQFDTEHNMPAGTRTVNVRNSTTETYQTNAVHPAINGYYQIADACYRDFIHKLQN